MISALIICKNEAEQIERCISSLLPVVDEILVLDSGSEDGTQARATSLGAQVVETSWKGYAATKNEGHALVKYPYLLSIDADEVLSESLQQSILQVKSSLSGAYAMARLTNYCGQWIRYAGWYPGIKVRLFPKETYWEGDFVHEKPILPTDTPVRLLTGDLLHYSIKDRADHKDRIDRYSRLKAQAYQVQGKHFSWLKAYLGPVFLFTKQYFLKLGILEGRLGLQLCWLAAKSPYLRQMYLKKLWKKEGALSQASPS